MLLHSSIQRHSKYGGMGILFLGDDGDPFPLLRDLVNLLSRGQVGGALPIVLSISRTNLELWK